MERRRNSRRGLSKLSVENPMMDIVDFTPARYFLMDLKDNGGVRLKSEVGQASRVPGLGFQGSSAP